MGKRIFNRTFWSGIGALILSLLPFFQEGSKMNPTSWVLLVIGAFLVVFGFWKPERSLSPKEASELLTARKQYLPKLKNNVNNITKQLEHIRDTASKMPVDGYVKKYFLDPSKHYKAEYEKHPNSMTATKLKSKFFIKTALDNPLYEDLKNKDDNLNKLKTEYNLLIPQVKDRYLKRKLENYWGLVDKDNSRIIFEQIVIRGKYPISLIRRKLLNQMEKYFEGKFKLNSITKIITRIDELLDGAPDK